VHRIDRAGKSRLRDHGKPLGSNSGCIGPVIANFWLMNLIFVLTNAKCGVSRSQVVNLAL
jgi:hypothetical protein